MSPNKKKTKTKGKTKQRRPKRASAAPKKKAAKGKRVLKSKTSKKPAVKKAEKKVAQKRSAPAAKTSKKASVSTERELQQEIRRRNLAAGGRVSSRLTGDLQGVSQAEDVDSESVEELVDEGNIFEAGAVAGVEEADNADEREVHTREMPEDDVPEEYLDEN